MMQQACKAAAAAVDRSLRGSGPHSSPDRQRRDSSHMLHYWCANCRKGDSGRPSCCFGGDGGSAA